MKPHPAGGAIFQFAIGISVEGYIHSADLILQRCKLLIDHDKVYFTLLPMQRLI